MRARITRRSRARSRPLSACVRSGALRSAAHNNPRTGQASARYRHVERALESAFGLLESPRRAVRCGRRSVAKGDDQIADFVRRQAACELSCSRELLRLIRHLLDADPLQHR